MARPVFFLIPVIPAIMDATAVAAAVMSRKSVDASGSGKFFPVRLTGGAITAQSVHV